MKSALWSVFRIGVLAIVLIAVPGLSTLPMRAAKR